MEVVTSGEVAWGLKGQGRRGELFTVCSCVPFGFFFFFLAVPCGLAGSILAKVLHR